MANRPVLFYGIEAMAARRASRRSGSSSPPRPATRSARPPATARGSAWRSPTSSRTSPPAWPTRSSPPSRSSATDPFVMYLGDNLLQGGIDDLVAAFRANAPRRADPAHPGARPRALRRRRARRRPRRARWPRSRREPRTNLALVGVYMFTALIHDAARAIEPSPRGELEITDAIQYLVDSGRRVEPHVVQGLVEGHRPPGGHARGQPPGPRHDRPTRVEGELIDSQVRRPRRHRGRARGSSARPSAGRRSSAPART